MKKTGYAFFLTLTLFVSGCTVTSEKVTEEAAVKIAMDNTGVTADQINQSSVESDKKGFTVTFETQRGTYIIQVADSGKVTGYQFTRSETTGPEESSQTENAEKQNAEKQKSESTAEENSETEEKAADQGDDLPEGSMTIEELSQRVAAHLGLANYDGETLKYKVDKDDTVIFSVPIDGIGTYKVHVDPVEGVVLATQTPGQ